MPIGRIKILIQRSQYFEIHQIIQIVQKGKKNPFLPRIVTAVIMMNRAQWGKTSIYLHIAKPLKENKVHGIHFFAKYPYPMFLPKVKVEYLVITQRSEVIIHWARMKL